MAEEVKKAGRPSTKAKIEDKVEVKSNIDEVDTLKAENSAMAEIMKQMQAQMAQMQAQLNSKDKTNVGSDNLPKRVKVINLLSNHLNLVTSFGKIYKFPKFGDVATLKTSDLDDILSNQKARKQAEEGYFYICDKAIIEDHDLTDIYETICDKNTIEHIVSLKDDSCVDMFFSLSDSMKESVSSAMIDLIVHGAELDRNRLATIRIKTGVDIEEMAEVIKKTLPKN